MYAHEDCVAVAVDEFDHLLRFAVHTGGHQSSELANAVIGVHHVVAHLQLVELLECEYRLAAACIVRTERNAMVTLEDLMIGVAGNLARMIHPSAVQRVVNRREERLTRTG